MLEIKTTATEVKNTSDGRSKGQDTAEERISELTGISKETCRTERQARKKTDGNRREYPKTGGRQKM